VQPSCAYLEDDRKCDVVDGRGRLHQVID
jgi:hypothetical protein